MWFQIKKRSQKAESNNSPCVTRRSVISCIHFGAVTVSTPLQPPHSLCSPVLFMRCPPMSSFCGYKNRGKEERWYLKEELTPPPSPSEPCFTAQFSKMLKSGQSRMWGLREGWGKDSGHSGQWTSTKRGPAPSSPETHSTVEDVRGPEPY